MSTASVIPPPVRGNVGEAGRRRQQAQQNEANTAEPVAEEGDEEFEPSRHFDGLASPTQPYEMEIKGLFRTFINFFQCDDSRKEFFAPAETGGDDSGSVRPVGFYRRSLEAICDGNSGALANLSETARGVSHLSGFVSFPIKLSDIKKFGPALETWILEFPADVIIYADEEIRSIVETEILPSLSNPELPFSGVRVAFFDHPNVCSLRDLDPTALERLVAIEGTCVRTSQLIPEMHVAVFRCTSVASRNFELVRCDNEVSAVVINGHVSEPTYCQRCQGRRTFVMIHDKCVFTSKQLMKVQESPGSIPEGETPQTSK
eukprot:Gregarina_sp_Poly_1__180@NODE_1041_length_5267_cov_150_372308_g721_i0_p3_GENE_NODE_1041_length_5267_cov_150_372308_g721_i0NODE_1041_length_5267_cov_150_372308_g721_i0_p3_ORF_typecomplete_len317_score53_30MCM_OB/PF17207_3/4_2e20MCM_N/PF14551_6/0_00091_NODE_1041_length_5267_cov_150_372308_g721_i0991049